MERKAKDSHPDEEPCCGGDSEFGSEFYILQMQVEHSVEESRLELMSTRNRQDIQFKMLMTSFCKLVELFGFTRHHAMNLGGGQPQLH